MIIAKLKENGARCHLVVKHGAAHGWPALDKDVSALAGWFDQCLLAKQ